VKYTITINQVGIARAGLDKKTDVTDWMIIDYLKEWFFSGYAKKVAFTDPSKGTHTDYVWVNYNHLMENLPLIHIKDKDAISKRFKKLKKLKLIDTKKMPDNSLYFILTPGCIDTCFYKEENENDLPLQKKVGYPIERGQGLSDEKRTAQVVDQSSSIKENNIKEIIDFLNQTLKSKFTSKSATTQKHINGRLREGHTVEDFKMVIEFKHLQWKHNGDMCQYLRPSTLFNSEKFEGYLEDARRNLPRLKEEGELL